MDFYSCLCCWKLEYGAKSIVMNVFNDLAINLIIITNYEHLCDVEIVTRLLCVMPMLERMQRLNKFVLNV
jgi:hypothetical protein